MTITEAHNIQSLHARIRELETKLAEANAALSAEREAVRVLAPLHAMLWAEADEMTPQEFVARLTELRTQALSNTIARAALDAARTPKKEPTNG